MDGRLKAGHDAGESAASSPTSLYSSPISSPPTAARRSRPATELVRPRPRDARHFWKPIWRPLPDAKDAAGSRSTSAWRNSRRGVSRKARGAGRAGGAHRRARAGACAESRGVPDLAARAAHLAKADLATEMVGEFPEFQGLIGRYYATRRARTRASLRRSRSTTSRRGRR